jgi:opacity protein-like surface antigen
MTIKKIAVFSLPIIMAAMTNAAYATAAGGYIGFTVGESNTHNKTQNVQTGVSQVAPTTSSDPTTTTPPAAVPVDPENTGMAGGFIIGYAFNPYAAFEFGYTHYASSTYNKPAGSQLQHDSTINLNTIDIAMKGSVPFKIVSIFGKLGLIEASASSSGSLQGVSVEPSGKVVTSGRQPSNNVLRPMYAVGVSYDITQNWVADLTYTTFTGSSGIQGADLLALGVSYHFVDLMCGQFLC